MVLPFIFVLVVHLQTDAFECIDHRRGDGLIVRPDQREHLLFEFDVDGRLTFECRPLTIEREKNIVGVNLQVYQDEEFDAFQHITGHFRTEQVECVFGQEPSKKIAEICGIVEIRSEETNNANGQRVFELTRVSIV